MVFNDLFGECAHERQHHKRSPKSEALKRQNVKITSQQELRKRRRSAEPKNERDPKTQQQRTKPSPGRRERCHKWKRNNQHSIGNEEIVGQVGQIEQEI